MIFSSNAAKDDRSYDARQADIARVASAEEAKRNRDFQERMFDNRYQKTVQDLRKAGLNKQLAYRGLSSGSPQGSVLPMTSAQGSDTRSAYKGMSLNYINSVKAYNEMKHTANMAAISGADATKARYLEQWYNSPEGQKAIRAHGERLMRGELIGPGKGIVDDIVTSAKGFSALPRALGQMLRSDFEQQFAIFRSQLRKKRAQKKKAPVIRLPDIHIRKQK